MNRPPTPTVSMMQIKNIEVRDRSRVVLTNIDSLASSIKDHGLLHAPVVRKDGKAWVLVAGQRRLEAMRLLGEDYIAVSVAESITDELDALLAEGEENTEREPFTPEEAVRHRKRIEVVVAEQAKKRVAAAGRKSAPGRKAESPSKLEDLSPPEHKRTTRVVTAKGTGFSATTLDKAEKVVKAAEENPALRPLVDEMNESGKVDAAFKALKVVEAKEQAQQVEKFVEHAIANDVDVAAAFMATSLAKARKAINQYLRELDPAACARLIERNDMELAGQWAERSEKWFADFREALTRPLHIVKENAR